MTFKEFKDNFEIKPVKEFPNQVGTNPKLSVCVPTYNHAEFIDKCLTSILNQETSFEFEILLGDDESSDGTREICIQYAKKHPDKIRLLLHSKENKIKLNNSVSGIFNGLYAFYSSRGQYIAYCDGDDYWTDKKKLEKQVAFLETHPDYILSFHAINYVNSKNEIINNQNINSPKRDLSQEELIKILYQPLLPTVCFRNVITAFPINITRMINSDNLLTSLLGHYGKARFQKNISPSVYRFHQNGIWSMINKEKKLLLKMQTYEQTSEYYYSIGQRMLRDHFWKVAKNYNKMLILLSLKELKLLKTFKYVFCYFKN